MKLELKHLAPYLPYGLKFLPIHYNKDKKLDTLYQLSTIYNSENFQVNGYTSNYIKPILRPLSDLTKDIDYGNGKPVKMINTFMREAKTLLEKELKNTNGNLIIDYLTWEILEKLFKYHFDVFGLIEKGLAININTLKK